MKPFDTARALAAPGWVGWSLVLAAAIALAPFMIWAVTRVAVLLGLA